MATRLYLRNDTWDTNRYKLATQKGAGTSTKVVNTAAAVEVQWTNGAGGAAIEWCSEPLQAAATISGTVSFNIWAQESNMSANAGARARLYKVSNDRATWTEMGGGPFDDQAEFSSTGSSNYLWTGAPTSNNALSVGERLGVRLYLDDNCGVALATGYTCTLTYDGATTAASGDTYIQTTENLWLETLTVEVTAEDLALSEGAVSADIPAGDISVTGLSDDTLALAEEAISATRELVLLEAALSDETLALSDSGFVSLESPLRITDEAPTAERLELLFEAAPSDETLTLSDADLTAQVVEVGPGDLSTTGLTDDTLVLADQAVDVGLDLAVFVYRSLS